MSSYADRRLAGVSLDIAATALALGAAVASVIVLIANENWWTIWLLFVPVAAASLPLPVRSHRGRKLARIVASILLLAWCVLAAASVGLFYVPSAVAMIWSAVRGRRG
jgi:hypothetical protein